MTKEENSSVNLFFSIDYNHIVEQTQSTEKYIRLLDNNFTRVSQIVMKTFDDEIKRESNLLQNKRENDQLVQARYFSLTKKGISC